jgi:hypothetical protein
MSLIHYFFTPAAAAADGTRPHPAIPTPHSPAAHVQRMVDLGRVPPPRQPAPASTPASAAHSAAAGSRARVCRPIL